MAVSAFHTYSGHRIWFTQRTAPGVWTPSTIYWESPTFSRNNHLTSGIELPGDTHRGVIINPSPLYSLDDERTVTTEETQIAVDNLSGPYLSRSRWNASVGAWRVGGVDWNLLQTGTSSPYPVGMVKQTDPVTWHAADQAHAPPAQVNFHVRKNASTADVFATVGSSTTQYGIYVFDFASETWAAPYGLIDFGHAIQCERGPQAFTGNGIYRFPNNDVGIIYSDNGICYYRLYTDATASWGSPVTIASVTAVYGSGLGVVIPDASGESLHVFEYHLQLPLATYEEGHYHIVEHSGTLHSNLFTFPLTIDTNGFTHGVLDSGSLFVGWPDDTIADANSCWVGPVTGGSTTFVQEFFDKPSVEAGNGPYMEYFIGAGAPPPSLARNYAYTGGLARTA